MGTANTNIVFVNLDLGLKSDDENLTGARATLLLSGSAPDARSLNPFYFGIIKELSNSNVLVKLLNHAI